MTDVLLWVGVLGLGGVGAILRTSIGATIDGRKRTPFPLGTFAVNVSGAFLVGCLYGAGLSGDPQLLAGTALIGAYTTFSTWMADSEKLVEGGQVEIALLNVFASIFIGLGIAFVGKAVGSALF